MRPVRVSPVAFGPALEEIRHPDYIPPHGTPARKARGCDCPTCLLAAAQYRQRLRGKPPTLRVMCDDHGFIVMMTPEEVRAGVMPSCDSCRRGLTRQSEAAWAS